MTFRQYEYERLQNLTQVIENRKKYQKEFSPDEKVFTAVVYDLVENFLTENIQCTKREIISGNQHIPTCFQKYKIT